MHLACDAGNEKAVARLREIKKRDGKPFAVMFRNMASLNQYAEVDAIEEKSLNSWKRPIVLLERKKDHSTPPLPDDLNAGLNLIGVMLPYMPFHYMLFERLQTNVIVLTSGNFSNEPIITSDEAALSKFSDITDAIILHNRIIFNRTDDSVVRIIGDRERVFRRSRGFVPSKFLDGQIACLLAAGAQRLRSFRQQVAKGRAEIRPRHAVAGTRRIEKLPRRSVGRQRRKSVHQSLGDDQTEILRVRG